MGLTNQLVNKKGIFMDEILNKVTNLADSWKNFEARNVSDVSELKTKMQALEKRYGMLSVAGQRPNFVGNKNEGLQKQQFIDYLRKGGAYPGAITKSSAMMSGINKDDAVVIETSISQTISDSIKE